MKDKRKIKTVEYGKYGYMFLIPFFVTFLVFQFYPLLYTFWVSLQSKVRVGRQVTDQVAYGLQNFTQYVFCENSEFFKALGVTVAIWILNFIPQIILSLLLAAWYTDRHNRLKGQGIYKVIIYMPNIITAAAISVLFYNLFDLHGGIAEILAAIGLIDGNNSMLKEGYGALLVIAFIQFWIWYGNTTIVFVAGIMGISPTLYEAAMVDGASPVQQFFKITLPLLKPILQFTLVTSAIGGLQMFDIPQLFNSGAPGSPVVDFNGLSVDSTQTIVMLIKKYTVAGTAQNLGKAAAYSVVLFIITLAVSMVFYKLTAEKKTS